LISAMSKRVYEPGSTIWKSVVVSEDIRAESLNSLQASLQYSGMYDRKERILPAHRSTFQWLFGKPQNESWDDFEEWLASPRKLYWVTGKAGSGKSTLMKFICSEDTQSRGTMCHKYLERWSGKRTLIYASYYFWSSGIEAQMTQGGLCSTLLSQIFEQSPG